MVDQHESYVRCISLLAVIIRPLSRPLRAPSLPLILILPLFFLAVSFSSFPPFTFPPALLYFPSSADMDVCAHLHMHARPGCLHAGGYGATVQCVSADNIVWQAKATGQPSPVAGHPRLAKFYSDFKALPQLTGACRWVDPRLNVLRVMFNPLCILQPLLASCAGGMGVAVLV